MLFLMFVGSARRGAAGIVPVLLVVFGAAVLPFGATAAADTAAGKSTAALQSQIGEASRAEVTATARWEAVHGKRVALDARLSRLDAAIGAARARAAAASHAADRFAATALAMQKEVRSADVRLRHAHAALRRSAVALYTTGTDTAISYTMARIDASSFSQAAAGAVYLQRASIVHHRTLTSLDVVRRRVAKARVAADAARARVEDAHRAAVADQAQLADLRAQRVAQRDAVARQETRENAVLASVRAQKQEATAQLDALQQTSGEISSYIHDLQVGEPRAPSFHALRPVPGPITSPYGEREHPVLGVVRMHTGIDFAAAYGDPIHAAAAGKIIWAGPRGGYGNAVVIDHGGEYSTLYGHASAIYVSIGEHVRAGQTIAAIGATGLATGPHLHFEVRVLGWCVDPAPYLS
jgi:murein DD-endopeptidase MepM/ murein hydrolase activator NlpD